MNDAREMPKTAPLGNVSPQDLPVMEIRLLLELYHGSEMKANRWLETPHVAFGRKPPKEFLADAHGRLQLRAYLKYEVKGSPIARHLLSRRVIASLSSFTWSSRELQTWLGTPFRFLSGKTPEQALNDADFGRLRLMLGQMKDGVFADIEWPEPQEGTA